MKMYYSCIGLGLAGVVIVFCISKTIVLCSKPLYDGEYTMIRSSFNSSSSSSNSSSNTSNSNSGSSSNSSSSSSSRSRASNAINKNSSSLDEKRTTDINTTKDDTSVLDFIASLLTLTTKSLTKQSNTYGVSTTQAALAPIPLPVNGKCIEGTVYTVDSTKTLYQHIPNIECLWIQGITPNTVPMGGCYGRLLTFANTAFIDPAVEYIYQGDYLLQTQCNGNYYTIGVLQFGGLDVSTGIWSISSLPSTYKFMEGEVYDGRAGILMDFTVTVDDYCPIEGNEKAWGPLLKGFSPFRTGTWPYRLFIDMLRAVGRDEDGCVLLLGRTWMIDPEGIDKPLYTVLFFVLKSCDLAILPDFKRGDPLPPVPKTYTYHRHGVYEFLRRLSPASFISSTLMGSFPSGIFDYNNYATEDLQPSQEEAEEIKRTDTNINYDAEKKGGPVGRTILELSEAVKNWIILTA